MGVEGASVKKVRLSLANLEHAADMQEINKSNEKLIEAFPASLQEDARITVSVLGESRLLPKQDIPARVSGQDVFLPIRIYNEPIKEETLDLTPLQRQLLSCLFTRHHDGFVRQQRLTKIITSGHEWIPPFVIRLVGEYVIEILAVIHSNLGSLNRTLYRDFLKENQAFFSLTEQRVQSYWSCNYRMVPKGDYVGFKLIDHFKSMLK
jgi:hypothetical protein